MARPKKEVEMTIPVENKDADCHHMVRQVGPRITEDGFITVDMADADVRTWLQAGYRLAFVEAIGKEPNGTNILYILVKDGTS